VVSIKLSLKDVTQPLGAQLQPDAAEQKAMIARIRDAALSYANRLQDFLCKQTTTRTLDLTHREPESTGRFWKHRNSSLAI